MRLFIFFLTTNTNIIPRTKVKLNLTQSLFLSLFYQMPMLYTLLYYFANRHTILPKDTDLPTVSVDWGCDTPGVTPLPLGYSPAPKAKIRRVGRLAISFSFFSIHYFCYLKVYKYWPTAIFTQISL